MTDRLKGKVALVTGGSSGLGKATALAYGREGASVVVSARRTRMIEEVTASINDSGGKAIAVTADVSSDRDVKALIDTTVDTYGRIDVAFNNAGGGGSDGLTHEISVEDYDLTMDVNLKGLWLCMKYELPHMIEQGSGSIVNMSSSAGVMGWNEYPIYTASKWGVVGLTKAAALQYAPMGIRINAICPAYTLVESMAAEIAKDQSVETKMVSTIPLGRMGAAEEVAEAVLWLSSDDSSFCIGHALTLDGGQTTGLWKY